MVTRVKELSTAPQASVNDNAKNASSLLPQETLKKLYALMLKSRMVSEAFARRSPEDGASKQWDCALGAEATEAATTLDLVPKDTIVPCGREGAIRVAAGESLKSIFPQKRGSTKGKTHGGRTRTSPNIPAMPRSSAMRLILGTGVALAYQVLKKRNVVLVITHGLSADAEAYREPLTIAANQKLPIVYVAVGESAGATSHTGHEFWTDPNVLPTIVVDGNDPVAVYRVAHEAIDHARAGGGPTIIDCRTQRWQISADERWREQDPLPRLETFLKHKHSWSEDWHSSLVSETEREIKETLAGSDRDAR